MKFIPPSIRATGFTCPHCSVLTSQTWFKLYADEIGGSEDRLPHIPDNKLVEAIEKDPNLKFEHKKSMLEWTARIKRGLAFLEPSSRSPRSVVPASNVHLSQCYNCGEIAVWIYERLLFPLTKFGILPNPDLPAEVQVDFDEAREIVNASPRGAAALLRLCVQKLCKNLGEKGKNIDDDIASLVKKGLNPRVQKSLDIVRVIGNEAVHPGVLDLKDDRDTAISLFGLINSIVDQMISQPKAVDDLYGKLPASKRKAIEERDKKSSSGGVS